MEKWLKNYKHRRKATCRFKHVGQHEFIVEYDTKTQEVYVSGINGSIKLPDGNVCFTKLDGITKIKPKTIFYDKGGWIFLVPIDVKPMKDCGFYIYYEGTNNGKGKAEA